jgi:hypothetical protein
MSIYLPTMYCSESWGMGSEGFRRAPMMHEETDHADQNEKPPQALSYRYPWDSVSRSHQTLCHPLHPQCTNYLFWLKTPLSSLSIISYIEPEKDWSIASGDKTSSN